MKTKSMKVIDNKLYMGAYSLEELGKKYGTPLYVYDEIALLDKINRYKNSFKSDKYDCRVVYASKAFICPYLASLLRQNNVYIDAISAGDLYLLKKANYPMEMVVLHGNNKSYAELTEAITSNIGYIVVDNYHELKLIKEISEDKKMKVRILFRINPGIEGHTHEYIETSKLDSKFGESIYDKELQAKIFNLIKSSEYIEFDGFHAHIGSQITAGDCYIALEKKLISFMKEVKEEYGIEFKTLNIGGGFGIKYLDSDEELDIETLLPKVVKEIEKELDEAGLDVKNLMIEPGRSIVGDSCVTIYTAGGVKRTYANVEYIFIDGGMPDNIRPALYDAKYTIKNASRYEADTYKKYNISGKCCESGDIIAKNVELPVAEVGDTIVAFTTGAYCYSMSMNYNELTKPGVIFVNNDKVTEVVRRQTPEDMLSCHVFSDDVKIFDTHSDMLYALDRKLKAGVENHFEDYHVNQLKDSVIAGGLWTMYSPDDFDLVEGLKNALKQIDMSKLPGFKVILGLEGLRNLKTVEDLDEIYNMGFRHAMVTWNEANHFATGARPKGNPEIDYTKRGLTEEGKRLYKRMQELDMIIDLAHLNEKSFYEALEIVDKNIIYSHGLCKALCGHVRNLTDDQMIALKKVDGLFGLTLANNFVSSDKSEQDLEHFLNHLDHAVKFMGIDNICFGFDFMDYLSEFPNSNIVDVPDATKAYRIIDGMRRRGYSEEDIKKVCYDNFYNRFKDKIVSL